MSEKRPVSQPNVPEPGFCPRCGHRTLIGDKRCPNCGQNLETPIEAFKEQPPNVIAVAAFGIGLLIAVASFGTEGLIRYIVLVLGIGIIIAGGLYYAAHLLITSDDRRDRSIWQRLRFWE